MKLKYKKIILLTTMSTMGIGLLTLSVSHDKSDAKESFSPKVTAGPEAGDDTSDEAAVLDAQVAAALTSEPSVAPTLSPTPSPTPTPMPVYDIEQEGTYPDIDTLINNYYSAKNNRDIEALKALLSDPSKADTQEELQKKTEYIDDYRNIKTYTKKSFMEGTYIVYAYHEIKFTSINTPAPGLAKFYVITDSDNKLKIFSGVMDEETKAYYGERNSDEDVIALIQMTDKKGDEAIESDEDLLNFWKSIDEMANGGSTEGIEGEGDSN
jgi:hypothetical protein